MPKKSREKRLALTYCLMVQIFLRSPVFPINYQGFIHPKGGCLGFLNHQQYWDVLQGLFNPYRSRLDICHLYRWNKPTYDHDCYDHFQPDTLAGWRFFLKLFSLNFPEKLGRWCHSSWSLSTGQSSGFLQEPQPGRRPFFFSNGNTTRKLPIAWSTGW